MPSAASLINSLRDEVTGFLTDMDLSVIVRDEMPMGDDRPREQFRIARTLRAHVFKVRLLLNPTEGESVQLVDMLTGALDRGGLTDEAQDQMVSHTQSIQKTEWERVKSGK